MKLTRKHLNHILLSLPHPSLVLEGRINPVIKVQVYEELALIGPDKVPDPNSQTFNIKYLTFEYSNRSMDWELKNLEV